MRIKQWFNTQSGNVSALVAAIYNQGPISVGIDASHLSFAFYSYGVYFEPACGKPEFCVYQLFYYSMSLNNMFLEKRYSRYAVLCTKRPIILF